MHRLFVAIRPPALIRDQLLDLMEGVPGARWQDEEQLHLTLRFIGEVERPLAEDIAVALALVRHPPFEIGLSGIGQFESRGRLKAVWAGVRPHDQLAQLHRKIDHTLVRAGLAPERRAYLPHITLARFGRDATGVERLLALQTNLSSPPFAVEHFGLFRSTLSETGAHYELIERYRLQKD